jgi:hypothetical protein
VEAAAEALACAAAKVGVVIKATEAAAAISPLKATSASPFVPESDCLDFENFLIERRLRVYPEMASA